MIRQRWIQFIALTSLAMLAMLAGYLLWQRSHQPDDAWLRIQQTSVWRVGMDPSFPPFESLDGDDLLVGYDVDMAQAIAARWSVTVTFRGIGFDSLLDAVIAGQVDAAISALPVEPRFARDVAFSIPYFEAGLVLVVRAADTDIQRVEDLADKRLAVELGSAGDARGRGLQRELNGLTLVPFSLPQEALNAAASGEADAALIDGVSAWEFAAQNREVRLLDRAVVSDPYVIVLPVQSPDLVGAVNKAIEEMRADGTLLALRRKWFGPYAD
ncbi:MAG: transporter substrate-binding domain-containing protein [Anaerolineae bacterium]|nr:transporter substrate-binding domain-containing protein [Anaerolineae bacterium]